MLSLQVSAIFAHLGYSTFSLFAPKFSKGSVIAIAMMSVEGVMDVEVLDREIKDAIRDEVVPEVKRSNLRTMEFIGEGKYFYLKTTWSILQDIFVFLLFDPRYICNHFLIFTHFYTLSKLMQLYNISY